MEINGLQVVSVAFSLFMMYFAYTGYRRKYFGKVGLFMWVIVFLMVMVAALFPATFIPFTKILKIARVFDLFTVIGLFFLIILTFINFMQIHKMNGKLGSYIQKEALKDDEEKNKD